MLEYTLSLNDRISGKLEKIGIANDRQLTTWAKVQQQVLRADATMRQCGVSIGSMRERIAALRTEREWIPADNIGALRRTNSEIRRLEGEILRLEDAGGGGLASWFGALKAAVPAIGKLVSPYMWLETACTMGGLQERIGSLYTQALASLTPLFDRLAGTLGEAVGWVEQHRDTLLSVLGLLAQGLGAAFALVGRIVGGAVGVLDGWLAKLREGSVPTTLLTALLGSLAGAMALFTLQARAAALWTGAVTTAKLAWAAAQNALNLSLLACPVTWIAAGVIALTGAIAYLCYKIDGWGSLWNGVVGFMKYSFMAFADGVKLYFTTLVNGIMNGLDKVKLGWYKFKEACGIGNSAENQAAIARINADVERRRQAIVDGAKKVAENANKAKESLSGIKMSWNSDKSVGDVVGSLKNKFGIGAPAVPGMAPMSGDEQKGHTTTGTAGAGAASAIATGGSRSTSVTINLKSLVEHLIFEGGYEQNRDGMQRDLESALIRVLQMANSAL